MQRIITNEWASLLADEFSKDYFKRLWHFVERQYANGPCYPQEDKIFAALNLCPPNKIKAVILGQDPYHEPGQAEGLCFSFSSGLKDNFSSLPDLFGSPQATADSQNPKRWPPSLRNILKEVSLETNTPMPDNGSLVRWAQQGVLMLNTVLTVGKGKANSHAGKGWEMLTDKIISEVNHRCMGVVFLLWGNQAQQKRALINDSRHLVIATAHPSPLSAYRGFFGSSQFIKANDYLISHGKEPIKW